MKDVIRGCGNQIGAINRTCFQVKVLFTKIVLVLDDSKVIKEIEDPKKRDVVFRMNVKEKIILNRIVYIHLNSFRTYIFSNSNV